MNVWQMVEKESGEAMIADIVLEDLVLVLTNAHKQAVENWTEGEIQEIWIDKDGYVCIAYESGKWWHYCKDKSGKVEWW